MAAREKNQEPNLDREAERSRPEKVDFLLRSEGGAGVVQVKSDKNMFQATG